MMSLKSQFLMLGSKLTTNGLHNYATGFLIMRLKIHV